MKTTVLCLLVAILHTVQGRADVVIGFENDATLINFNTYSESGYTFTRSSFQVNIEDAGVASDGTLALRTFTNGTPFARMTNDLGDLFDLVSLEIDDLVVSSQFLVEGSSGASHSITSTGTINFSGVAGDWTNLSFVDIRYTGPSTSEHMLVDNVRVAAAGVPEPASGMIIALLLLVSLVTLRRYRLQGRPTVSSA